MGVGVYIGIAVSVLVMVVTIALTYHWFTKEERCKHECVDNGLVFLDWSTDAGCRCLPADAIRTLHPEPIL